MSAGFSDTWLAPLVGYTITIKEYADGRKIAFPYDRSIGCSVKGNMKYLSKPIKATQ